MDMDERAKDEWAKDERAKDERAKDERAKDERAKEVAPTSELRRWYGHEPARFAEFEHRCQRELAGEPAVATVERFRHLAALRERLVLLTATSDVEHSAAAVLEAVIRTHTST